MFVNLRGASVAPVFNGSDELDDEKQLSVLGSRFSVGAEIGLKCGHAAIDYL